MRSRGWSRKSLRKSISQSYLSQIESGARPHLTNSTRMLLARFFKVHPGYLVDDPEGFQNELISDLGALEDKLDLWLIAGAERFRRDVDLHQALLTVAKHEDSRMCLVLLGAILEKPGLAERLIEVLKTPPATAAPKPRRRCMTWAEFYLICFLVGFGLSLLSLLAGSVHLHLPHLHLDHGVHIGHGHGGGGSSGGVVVQLRNDRGVSGVVRRHGLPAGALLRRVVRGGAGDRHASAGWAARRGLLVPGQGADGARGSRWIRRTTTWSACWASSACRSAPAAPGEMIFSQEGARRVAGARSENRAPRSPRAPKWWSRATKKASRTSGRGKNSRAIVGVRRAK